MQLQLKKESFGLSRSCCNELKESPPQLTHGKKVDTEVGSEIAGFSEETKTERKKENRE